MSVMEKIFGAFKPAPTTADGKPINTNVQQAQPGPTNNLQTNPEPSQTSQTPGTSPNGIVPAQGDKPPESPLGEFKDVWQPAPVDPNAKKEVPVDPTKIFEAAAKVDFSQVLSREDLAKVSAGGDDAINALVNALNKTAQATYAQSVVAANKMVDLAVANATRKFEDNIPNLIKQQNLGDNLRNENPAFNNPAIAPVIDALKVQLSERFPKATSNELTQMAKNYLTGAAALISPPSSKTQETSRGPQEEDWSTYLKDPV